MKTPLYNIHELIKDLPEYYQNRILDNMKLQSSQKWEFKDLMSALEDGFYWDETEEGFEFWDQLAHHVNANNPKKVGLPKIPKTLVTPVRFKSGDEISNVLTMKNQRIVLKSTGKKAKLNIPDGEDVNVITRKDLMALIEFRDQFMQWVNSCPFKS